MTAADVIAAVLRESAAVSVSATQFFVAGLRSFLRFCFIEGLVEVGPVTGGAAGRQVGAARRCRGGSPSRMPTRCLLAVIVVRRSGDATTR